MLAKTAILNPVVLAFVAGAVISWGVYVPIVHRAAEQLHSSLRAFLFVGVAYFLTAVLIPLVLIFILNYDPTTKGQAPNFNIGPVSWGVAAGVAGAVGALCVIFAATNAGKGGALYVAPLVFAGAPIINTIVTMTIFHPVKKLPELPFFLGLLLAAVGAALVMIYKPKSDDHTPAAATSAAITEHVENNSSS
jgi:drug/metabolite transporter (DMT)-like permease